MPIVSNQRSARVSDPAVLRSRGSSPFRATTIAPENSARTRAETSPYFSQKKEVFPMSVTLTDADAPPVNLVEEESHSLGPSLRAVKLLPAILVLNALLLSGCGGGDGVERLKVHPVQGVVTWEGKPLANAQIAFHPKNPTDIKAKVALATTDAEGKYQLTTYDTSDGAVAGEFTVTVQYFQLQQAGESFSPGPNVLSPIIATPEKSDIVLRVAEGPNLLTPIEVKR